MNDEAKKRFNRLYLDDMEDITEFLEWLLKEFQFDEISKANDGRYWFVSNDTLEKWKNEDGWDKIMKGFSDETMVLLSKYEDSDVD